MKKRYIGGIVAILIIAAFFFVGNAQSVPDRGIEITTFKSPTCGCCGIWTKYTDNQGFDVNVNTVSDAQLSIKKNELGIPANLESCHTSLIEGYIVEGHIPVEAIDKLLSEKPDIKGIALAGMPSGTPGMPGPKTEDWTIYALNNDGTTSVFMVI